MKLNYNIIVKLRMWLNNLDAIESDKIQGVRFNREHYIKVLEARQNKGIPQPRVNVFKKSSEYGI